jgi:glycerol-3-phosphate O-acyltransferase
MIRRETRRLLRAYDEGSLLPAPTMGQGRVAPTRAPQPSVRAHLAGLVACRRPWAERLLSLLTWPVLRGGPRIGIEEEPLAELRELAARGGPLIFLPAHRSYADSLVLAAALRDAGIPAPWRLAGANLSFWPLGPLARRTGTIFIRRDFGLDPSYHVAVRCCLADLLARAQNLEWYPEAGRSRTGRLRGIRTGMLRLLVAAYLDSGIEDVHVIPVSIVYDALPDTEAVVEQDAGAAKRPEGVRALVRYLRAGHALGPRCAWPSFGQPISLRELSRSATNEWDTVRVLARRVAIGLRDATRVTVESLLALVLAQDADTLRGDEDLAEQISALLRYTGLHGIPVCGPNRMETALDGMVRTRVLTRCPEGYALRTGRQRVLGYHRNVVEHWFLPRAAAELVATGDLTARRVSELLAPLHSAYGRPKADAALDAFAHRVEEESTALDGGWARQPFLLAPPLLTPVFQAYHAAAATPAATSASAPTASAAPPPTDTRSAELRVAADNFLAHEKLLGDDRDATARREVFLREISLLLARLRLMAALDADRHSGIIADVRH